MSEKPAKSPLYPHSTRGEIAEYINHALEAGDMVEIYGSAAPANPARPKRLSRPQSAA
jgi:hypothetical protein